MRSIDQYAGDVDSQEAFNHLSEKSDTVLIDVRTRAEWAFVGVPDLRPIGKQALFVEWQGFPPEGPNPDFVNSVTKAVTELGLDRTASVFLLCRSGARSQAAAIALTQQAGFSGCFNVADGFEGPLDSENHRGSVTGWKARGLPWIQN